MHSLSSERSPATGITLEYIDRSHALETQRSKRAKLNISVSLVKQAVTLICGLIVPRIMLRAFGSEANGAVSSIAQFLAYISLLEGGIGGVARASLYKPLADGDYSTVGSVMFEIQRFFRIIGLLFAGYVVILACSFSYISRIQCFDWLNTAILVVVISISTLGQYFIGITYSIVIQASQRVYITDGLAAITTVLNTAVVLMLVHFGCNLIVVKLASSIVFIIRPYLMMIYVRRKLGITAQGEKGTGYLNQKWTGLGQHIAYFLHSNTDVSVLTIFRDLKLVSVYSVYHMVVYQIQNITVSFSSGLESLFGEMQAKHEANTMRRTFDLYETMISIVSTVLFGTALGMIVPFVRIYTAAITDANYIEPLFGTLLIIASILFCWKLPYQAAVHSAGHYKQTRMGAYGEALINIVVSIVLVIWLGLVGVAIGTILATLFRLLYYVVYLKKNILYREIGAFFLRQAVNTVNLAVLFVLGQILNHYVEINKFMKWIPWATAFFAVAAGITLVINYVFYRNTTMMIISKVRNRGARRNGRDESSSIGDGPAVF